MKFYNNKISIAFDLYGCPQKCSHCWLGTPGQGRLAFDDVIRIFSDIKREQLKEKYYDSEIEYLGIDYYEPHFSNNYRNEYETIDRINGAKYDIDRSFNLISLYRAARDPEYLPWCRERGITEVQLKLFGFKNVTNDMIGRDTAYDETLAVAHQLFDIGIKAKFQLYLTKRSLPNINDLVSDLTEKKLLPDNNIHIKLPDAVGNGYALNRFRITEPDYQQIPEILIESTKSYFNKKELFRTGEECIRSIKDSPSESLVPGSHWLWFFADRNLDVYTNLGYSLSEKSTIGSLKNDSWKTIMDNYYLNKPVLFTLLTDTATHDIIEHSLPEYNTQLFESDKEFIDLQIEHISAGQ